jgi:hypothetical protein
LNGQLRAMRTTTLGVGSRQRNWPRGGVPGPIAISTREGIGDSGKRAPTFQVYSAATNCRSVLRPTKPEIAMIAGTTRKLRPIGVAGGAPRIYRLTGASRAHARVLVSRIAPVLGSHMRVAWVLSVRTERTAASLPVSGWRWNSAGRGDVTGVRFQSCCRARPNIGEATWHMIKLHR